MDAIAARLDGVAASVAFVEWPDAPEHGDAADFLEMHPGSDVVTLPRTPYEAAHSPGSSGAGFGSYRGARQVWRTLSDVADDPPGLLILGMLEPAGPTLAYAAPGVGKGTTGAWIVVECLQLGMKPMIYDAERRPREWARRVSGLGGDRSRVIYIEPPDLGPTYAGCPFWESAEAIGSAVRASGADIIIVDSILPSVGLGEERLRSAAQVPYLYVQALDALGIPSLSFGHPPEESARGRALWFARVGRGDAPDMAGNGGGG